MFIINGVIDCTIRLFYPVLDISHRNTIRHFNSLCSVVSNNYMAFCFPTSCLKVFIGVGALVTMLLAVSMLGLTIYANVQKDKIIDKGDVNIANGALVGLYVAAILFLVMGFAGLYGSIKKNRMLLALFSIGTFLFVIVFLLGTILFFVAPKTIFDGTCQASKTNWIQDLANLNAVAQDMFCRVDCPCNFTNSDNIYTPDEVTRLNDTDGTIFKVQDCPTFMSQNFSEGNILLMATLESELQCGGWCGNNDLSVFHFFTNVNSGPRPKEPCYTAFKGFFERNGMLVGIGCAAAMSFAILNMIMICCLCFHPSRTGNKANFYRRMIDDD